MQDQPKHMDEMLRDRFRSFEADIPMSDWNAIAEKLDKKRRIIWLWWAAIPLLLILSYVSYYYLNQDKGSKPVPSEIAISNPASDVPLTDQDQVSTPETAPGNTGNTGNTVDNSTQIISPDKTAISSQEEITDIGTDPDQTLSVEGFDAINILSKQASLVLQEPMLQVEKAGLLQLKQPAPSKKEPSPFTFEAGLNISPAMGNDVIRENASRKAFINRNYFNSIAGSSSLGNGFNNGVHFQVNYKQLLYFRTGFYTTSYTSFKNYNYTISEYPNWDSKGIYGYVPMLPETVKYDGQATIKFIGIPLALGSRFATGKRTGIETRLGVNLSNYAGSSGKVVNPLDLNLENANSNNSIKKWTSAASVSAGVYFKTKNNLIFTVEPNYTTLLGSAYTKTYPVKGRFYNYGINLNVNYLFKKGGKQ